MACNICGSPRHEAATADCHSLQYIFPYNAFPPFVSSSDTSLLAAERIEPIAGSLRRMVLDYLRRTGGETCDAAEAAMGLRHQTASARIRELFLTGHIIDSKERRKTRSGRWATVWKAA